ncbi:MAG TPA: hypothetical protein VF933_23520 [Streptosporangiaceae bacterium]
MIGHPGRPEIRLGVVVVQVRLDGLDENRVRVRDIPLLAEPAADHRGDQVGCVLAESGRPGRAFQPGGLGGQAAEEHGHGPGHPPGAGQRDRRHLGQLVAGAAQLGLGQQEHLPVELVLHDQRERPGAVVDDHLAGLQDRLAVVLDHDRVAAERHADLYRLRVAVADVGVVARVDVVAPHHIPDPERPERGARHPGPGQAVMPQVDLDREDLAADRVQPEARALTGRLARGFEDVTHAHPSSGCIWWPAHGTRAA